MKQSTPVLGSGMADLLAIPALMLEFQPTDSVVAVCLRGNKVQFCARSDLDLAGEDLEVTAGQLVKAMRNTSGREFVLLGFGRDLPRVRDALVALGDCLGGLVTVVVASNHERYWELEDGVLPSHDGDPYTAAESPVTAHAVLNGVPLSRSRSEAVAVVQRPPAHLRAGVSTRLEDAFERVLTLDPDDRIELFGRLMGSEDPLGPDDAAELAALFVVPECNAEFLCQLGAETADRFQARLLEARAAADEECEAAVLGPLALACWRVGKGALMNECLVQLYDVAPHAPVLSVLDKLVSESTPPCDWDKW